jgi:putative addiction module killer protein
MFEIIQSKEFAKWLNGIRDLRAKARIDARLAYIEKGNLGDIKPVGDGVSEMRIHYGADYRLYFIKKGTEIIVMLGGGDKSSQERDILKAKKIASEWR